jgi:ribosomal protein S19
MQEECDPMKNSKGAKFLAGVVVGILLPGSNSAVASGESIGTISHIHSVRAFGDQVILGTHEGLFRYVDAKTVQSMGPENFDIMGLAVFGKKLYASGHPGPGSKLPEPVGLLLSTDNGKNWKKVGLQGEVDFHLLESAGVDMYGVDSGSGDLLYSKDAGKKWVNRGKNILRDIAINPNKIGSALALRNGKLISTQKSFTTIKATDSALTFTSLDWIPGSLLGTAGKSLYRSSDLGATWKKVSDFPDGVSTVTQSVKIIAVVSGDSIFKSIDGGKTFKKM